MLVTVFERTLESVRTLKVKGWTKAPGRRKAAFGVDLQGSSSGSSHFHPLSTNSISCLNGSFSHLQKPMLRGEVDARVRVNVLTPAAI